MNIIFMGTPEFSVPVLDALLAAGHKISAVYCQPPRPAGRGKKTRLSPVQARAEALGLPVRYPVSLKNSEAQAEFASFEADTAVVVAYGLLLPQVILGAPKYGCLNIHASLLPRWRGAAPIHRAIMAGDRETGVCIMQMEAGLDTGPVLLRKSTPIGSNETTAKLHDRLSEMGAAAVVESLAQLTDLDPVPQSDDGVTYATKIDKSEARLIWDQPSEVIDRNIRGLSPFPGAWALADGERIKFLQCALAEGTGIPGEVLHGMTIACKTGAVEITVAQRQGKRPLAATDFLRGKPLPKFLT